MTVLRLFITYIVHYVSDFRGENPFSCQIFKRQHAYKLFVFNYGQAADAVLLDSSGLSFDETVQAILQIVEAKHGTSNRA